MKLEDVENNIILKLSFAFSLEIIDFCIQIDNNKQYLISKQLLKSGTSIGTNAMEAQNAESTADFIHKFKIAAKEANETQYWLLLCNHSKHYPNCDGFLEKAENINKVINNIISTSKRKIQY